MTKCASGRPCENCDYSRRWSPPDVSLRHEHDIDVSQESPGKIHTSFRYFAFNSRIIKRMRTFDSLTEREILALAISLEEEDERVYADFAEGLHQDFPGSAAIFEGMREEESTHRRRLIDLFHEKFGDHIPLLRRQDVRGFVRRVPIWLVRPLGLETVRNQASAMELETRNFY